ncbi:MAG: 1-acyl-sn-glycerol-3-phosphate acyltransferase, partial [Actinobacteria bacterium]|nr:1-acyl-sn-glycerol-3-phosphate acyltransferase [Actinomycetota bacterium]
MTDIVYPPIVFTAKTLFRALGIKFDIVGSENLPRVGGAVIAINHTSYLDFALSGIPADRIGHRYVRFMAKDGIFKHKVAGPLMRGMHHIPVDRDAGSQAFRDAVRALKSGELVGVFPEATMSRSMEVKEIKNGAVRMAVSANVPLIPMIV